MKFPVFAILGITASLVATSAVVVAGQTTARHRVTGLTRSYCDMTILDQVGLTTSYLTGSDTSAVRVGYVYRIGRDLTPEQVRTLRQALTSRSLTFVKELKAEEGSPIYLTEYSEKRRHAEWTDESIDRYSGGNGFENLTFVSPVEKIGSIQPQATVISWKVSFPDASGTSALSCR